MHLSFIMMMIISPPYFINLYADIHSRHRRARHAYDYAAINTQRLSRISRLHATLASLPMPSATMQPPHIIIVPL